MFENMRAKWLACGARIEQTLPDPTSESNIPYRALAIRKNFSESGELHFLLGEPCYERMCKMYDFNKELREALCAVEKVVLKVKKDNDELRESKTLEDVMAEGGDTHTLSGAISALPGARRDIWQEVGTSPPHSLYYIRLMKNNRLVEARNIPWDAVGEVSLALSSALRERTG